MRIRASVAAAALLLVAAGCENKPAAKGRPNIGETGYVYHEAQPSDVPLMERQEDFDAMMKAAASGDQVAGAAALGRAVLLPPNAPVTTLGFSPRFYRVRVLEGPAKGREGWVAPAAVHVEKKAP